MKDQQQQIHATFYDLKRDERTIEKAKTLLDDLNEIIAEDLIQEVIREGADPADDTGITLDNFLKDLHSSDLVEGMDACDEDLFLSEWKRVVQGDDEYHRRYSAHK